MEGFQFLSCIHFSAQLMMAECAFLLIFPRREHFAARILCSMALYSILLWGIFSVVTAFPGYVLLVRICYYTLVFVMTLGVMWFCFELSSNELLFVGVGGYALQHLAFGIMRMLFYIFPFDNTTLLGRFLYHWFLYLLIPAAFYWFVIRTQCDKEELKRRDSRMLWLSALILVSAIIVSLLIRSDLVVEPNSFLQDFVCSLYIILCCIPNLFLLFHIPREAKLRHESEVMEQMMRTMDERLQISKKNVEIINRKCHDIKYQLRVLLDSADRAEQNTYVCEITQAISVYESIYQTGNTALDFVLCERGPIFQEEHIQFSCIADGALLNFMRPLDISTLFGNALDNAIECVMQEDDFEKRIINLRIAPQGKMVHIHVDNYCSASLTFQDDLPVTTKLDEQYHGFGSRSIRYIIEKYGGFISFRQEENRFLLDAACVIAQK